MGFIYLESIQRLWQDSVSENSNTVTQNIEIQIF